VTAVAGEPADRLVSAAAAARQLGVDVATLVRWHTHNRGPAAIGWRDGLLAYRRVDLEAWEERIGGAAASAARTRPRRSQRAGS
jgi:hypothetical protein